MRRYKLFTLDTPYREPLSVIGFEFGNPEAENSVAIVGSLRGNEHQQTYICANMVSELAKLEEAGQLSPDAHILVIPCANAFSMNISNRFWPMDNTDVNRMFPGYDQGETTQRIADGIFRVVKDFKYGIQLCSYYLPGEFAPHVRITDTGCIDMEASLALAEEFGVPYVMRKQPAPFDTTTLNYNWQVWETMAYSLYSCETDFIDEESAQFVQRCILRFLNAIGASALPIDRECDTLRFEESGLINLRTSRAGFFRLNTTAGAQVSAGDVIAEVLSTDDCRVLERIESPVDGLVFFHHVASLINAETIAFKVLPD